MRRTKSKDPGRRKGSKKLNKSNSDPSPRDATLVTAAEELESRLLASPEASQTASLPGMKTSPRSRKALLSKFEETLTDGNLTDDSTKASSASSKKTKIQDHLPSEVSKTTASQGASKSTRSQGDWKSSRYQGDWKYTSSQGTLDSASSQGASKSTSSQGALKSAYSHGASMTASSLGDSMAVGGQVALMAVGAQGASMAVGAQGASMAVGAQGASMAVSAQGTSMAVGAQGALTAVSAKGASTAVCAQRASKAAGAQGSSMAAGAQGDPMVASAQGASMAAGTQGALMVAGAQGALMAASAQGASMAASAKGASKAASAKGASKAASAKGALMAADAQGASMAAGAQGASMAAGAQGASMAAGAQGASMAAGAQGASMAVGAQGALMAVGTQGASMIADAQGTSMAASAQYASMAASAQFASMAAGSQGASMAAGAQGALMAAVAQGALMAAVALGASMASGAQGASMTAGAQGASMAASTQGASMAASTQGPSMAAGTQGVSMAASNRGAVVATSTQGASMAAGTQGATVATGTQDAVVVVGTQGATVATGTQGVTPAAVAASAQGAAVAAGAQGWLVAASAQGATVTGSTQWPTGAQGVAVTGSTQCLTGTKGAAGAAMAAGSQRSVVAAGAQGSVVAAGAQEAAVADGTQGAAVVDNAQWPTGTQGASVAVGAHWPTSAQGAAMTAGAQGEMVSAGTQGAAVADGTQGVAVADNTQGAIVAEGTQGAIVADGTQEDAVADGTQGDVVADGTPGAALADGAEGAAMARSHSMTQTASQECFMVERPLLSSLQRYKGFILKGSSIMVSEIQSSRPNKDSRLNLETMCRAVERKLGPKRFEEILSKFTGDKSEKELFSCIYSLEELRKCTIAPMIVPEKDEIEAEELLSEGNKQFQLRNYEPALEYYNQALLVAPNPRIPATLPRWLNKAFDDELRKIEIEPRPFAEKYRVLAQIYADRSAVQFAKEKYENCLIDANFALIYGSTGNAKKKLEIRKRLCMELLDGNKSKCRTSSASNLNRKFEQCKITETVHPAGPSLTFGELNDRLEQYKLTNEMGPVIDLLLYPYKKGNVETEATESVEAKANDSVKSVKPPVINNSNEAMKTLSNAVRLEFNSEKGRHLIARQAIRPGEVLATDTSYVSAQIPGSYFSFCCTCYKKCVSIHPCPYCPQIVFCGVKCWAEGITGDHEKECSSLASLIKIQEGIEQCMVPSLAFKAVLKVGFKYIKENFTKLEQETLKSPLQQCFDEEGKFIATDFRNIFHLETNKEKLSSRELYSKCVTAFVLLKMLILTGRFFFDSEGGFMFTCGEEMIDVGAVILRLLLNLSFNACEISSWEMRGRPVSVFGKHLGGGVYPTIALVNHSCNPTARIFFDGNKVVLRAITFIPMGSEITVGYCGSYYEFPIASRHRKIAKYFVQCKCEACIGNWPVIKDLPSDPELCCIQCGHGVSVVTNKIVCGYCHLNYSRRKGDKKISAWWRTAKLIQEARTRFLKSSMNVDLFREPTQKDVHAAGNYIEVLKKHSNLPVRELCVVQETLMKLFVCGL